MSTEIRVLLVIIAAVSMFILGALGMWVMVKLAPPQAQFSPQPIVIAPPPANDPPKMASAPADPPPAPALQQAPAPQQITNDAPPTNAAIPVNNLTPVTPPVNQPTMGSGPQNVLAKVIKVKAHYITKSVPFRVCHDVPRTVMSNGNPPTGAGAVLGGVAGGIVGHQIGGGRGNVAATIGGAIVGGMLGNQIERSANEPRAHTIYVTECTTRYRDKSILTGYDVTYIFNGQIGTKFMKKPPKSSTIMLTVEPGLKVID